MSTRAPGDPGDWELPVHSGEHLDASLDRLVSWLDDEVRMRLLHIDFKLNKVLQSVQGSSPTETIRPLRFHGRAPGSPPPGKSNCASKMGPSRLLQGLTGRSPRGMPQGDLSSIHAGEHAQLLSMRGAEGTAAGSRLAAEAGAREAHSGAGSPASFPGTPRLPEEGGDLGQVFRGDDDSPPMSSRLSSTEVCIPPAAPSTQKIPVLQDLPAKLGTAREHAAAASNQNSARLSPESARSAPCRVIHSSAKPRVPQLGFAGMGAKSLTPRAAQSAAQRPPPLPIFEGKAENGLRLDAYNNGEELSPRRAKLMERFSPRSARGGRNLSPKSAEGLKPVRSPDAPAAPDVVVKSAPQLTSAAGGGLNGAQFNGEDLATTLGRMDIHCAEVMGGRRKRYTDSSARTSGSSGFSSHTLKSNLDPSRGGASGISGFLPEGSVHSGTASERVRSGGPRRSGRDMRSSMDWGALLMPARSEWAQRVWLVLDDAESSRVAKAYEQVMQAFILLTVLSSMMQAVANPPLKGLPGVAVESCIDTMFILEVLLRWWVCPNRLMFFRSSYNLIDILSGAPLALRALMDFAPPSSSESCVAACGVLIGFVPVLRLAKVLRRFIKFHLLLKAFKVALEALPVMIFVYVMIMLGFTGVIYLVEERDNIPSYYYSMWLTIVSMTTLGYGDAYPEQDLGRVTIGLCVICTLFYSAIPLGIIGNAFNDVWKDRDRILLMQRARDGMKQAGYTAKDVKKLFEIFDKDKNGQLDAKEFRWMLEGMRLGLKRERMMELYQVFDDDHSGGIDEAEFVKGLFPESYHDLYGEDDGEGYEEFTVTPAPSRQAVLRADTGDFKF